MAITGAEVNRRELTANFTQQLISVLQANNTTLPAHAVEIISEEVDAVIKEQLANESLQKKMYLIYARYFSLEELQGLIAFNQSPIGIKANQVMPILMRESMSAAQTWSVEIGPLLSDKIRTRLEKEGVVIGP